MSQKRSRLRRKADRVVRDEVELEHDVELGKIRREYDVACTAANTVFRDGAKKLQEERTEARKTAWATYQEKRADILKAFSEKAKAAA